MQRLARLTKQEGDTVAVALFSQYDELISILQRYLPPSTASLFARPRQSGDYVEWYTDLEGQPYPLGAEQDKPLASKINTLITQRLQTIEQLADELRNNGKIQPIQAELLQKLVQATKQDTRQVYLINNEPVIIGWGMGKEPPKPVTAPVALPTSAATSHRRCWWLLPLLLLLLGFLVWWFYFLPQQQMKLLQGVKAEIHNPQIAKQEPTMPKIEEPKVVKQCKKVLVEGNAPQLAIIFNNASGMSYTIKETTEQINKFDQRLEKEKVPLKEINYMLREPNRSTASKAVFNKLLDQLDPAIDVGFVELKSCLSNNTRDSAVSHGIFQADQRGKLKSIIAKLNVRDHKVPGTPIYEGLERALKLVDGKDREAYILLVTEGNGDCTKRNICQLIKDTIVERPKLKVNIVGINSPWRSTDCLAEISGGKIINAEVSSEQELLDEVNKAIQPMVEEEHCEEVLQQ